MVGKSGAGHLHHGGKVGDALLSMAQQPEKPQSRAVPQLPEQLCQQRKMLRRGHMVQQLVGIFVMVVGQSGHVESLLFSIIAY
jgi:hypothetical protein